MGRKHTRTALALAAIAAVCASGALGSACGSASGAAGFTSSSGGDAGGSSGSESGSGSGSSSGGFADASFADATSADASGEASAPPPTTALFLHGSPSLPSVRLCWGAGSFVSGLVPFPGSGEMPASNYPGIPPGGAAAIVDAPSVRVAAMTTLYAFDSKYLEQQEILNGVTYTCDELVCSPTSPWKLNTWCWQLPLPSTGLQPETDNVITVAGCFASFTDPAASTTRCGSDWDAVNGNLHAELTHLTATAADSGLLLVQAAQLSAGLGALLGDAGAAQVAFGAADAGDASVAVASLNGEGHVAAAHAVTLGSNLASYGNLGFSVDVPGDDSGAGHVWMSLAQAQQLVDPTQDPTLYYGLPRPYVLAVLGDPVAPHALTAGYDGHGLHLLVVAPARPVLPEAGGGGDAHAE